MSMFRTHCARNLDMNGEIDLGSASGDRRATAERFAGVCDHQGTSGGRGCRGRRGIAPFVVGVGAGAGRADRGRSPAAGGEPFGAGRQTHHAPPAAPGERHRAEATPDPGTRRAWHLLHHGHLGARLPRLRLPPDRPHPRLQPSLPQPTRRCRPSRQRRRAGGGGRLVWQRRPRDGALWRRLLGRVGRQPARGRRSGHHRGRPPRPRARVGRDIAGGSHPGRRPRPALGGPAPPGTATRCATSRSASDSPPSAAGSRTRSGGHYATNHTHIDDFVESVRMLTPQGWWESRRLPGSGAGPIARTAW